MANGVDNAPPAPQPVVIVVVPFPAQSHLNQLLQLSCVISQSFNLPVYYVCSSSHVRQAKLRHSSDNLLTKIQFHSLDIPPFPLPPPSLGEGTDFPTHLHPLFEASSTLREPFATFIQTLRSKTTNKIVVIHDNLMAFVVQDAASLQNIELYAFRSTSAFTAISWEISAGNISVPQGVNFPAELPSKEGCYTEEFERFVALKNEFLKLRSGDLRNTCRVIEGDFIDLQAKSKGIKKDWAVGPLNLMVKTTGEQKNSESKVPVLEWLDKQPSSSVIYVSFGTTSSMVEDQIKELAKGLEESKIKFIWVLKNADKGDIFAEEEEKSCTPSLPEGFEERTKGVQGMVVRGWQPQTKILEHPSTGGFMSHCGWGSCMESISSGVPIVAWPIHSDQPRNAAFVAQVLNMGVVLREWSRRGELVTASAVARAVRTVMASKEGEVMKKRAEELGKSIREATEEGGVSRIELESFINHITRF